MSGLNIYCPTIMLNYNESAVNNRSKIEYTLKKKHSSVSYHLVCHNVAAGVVKIGWILTADNMSDAFTRRLAEAKRKHLFGDWNYWLPQYAMQLVTSISPIT